MRKISYWRYSAVKLKTLLTALACALLVFSMLGCGTTNHLQSIQLSSSNSSETVTGTVSIGINGPVVGPVQLYTWANYSNGKQVLLNGTAVVYKISLDANTPFAVNPGDNSFYPLDAPPQTMQLSATGLLTAVDPSACSWFNSNAGTKATQPAWSAVGVYLVTATYSGFTSPPVFVAAASAPGYVDLLNNPTGACGPSGK